MKININELIHQINQESKLFIEESKCNEAYKILNEIYEGMINNSLLSGKRLQLVPPQEEYKSLDYCRNGSIYYNSGSWGSYRTEINFFISTNFNAEKELSSCIRSRFIGPRGGDRGDYTSRYATIEEGVKAFIKKVT